MTLSNTINDEKLERLRTLRHAIKNDVSVIIAFAQLVKKNPSDEKAAQFLSKIEARSKIILTNIEQYLNQEMGKN